jgi:acyl carrier protein
MIQLFDATGRPVVPYIAVLYIMECMGDDSTPQVPATPADATASSTTEMSEDLKARVIKVIAKTQRIPLETVSIDSTFEELKIDSLDGINLIFALESEFNVDIPDEDARAIKSVRQMAEGIAQLVAQKQLIAQKAPEPVLPEQGAA